MNYVTTNIRLPEDDYLKLKAEAAKKRKSLSAVIREKVGVKDQTFSKSKVEKFMRELDKIAESNAKKLKGWDSLKALREIRDEN